MKPILMNALILIAGIGLLIGGFFVCLESTALGVCMVLLGLVAGFFGVSNLMAAFKELKELLVAESLAGETTTKKKVIKYSVIAGGCCVLVFALAVTVFGFSRGMEMNSYANRILELHGDGNSLSRIAEFEERFQGEWLGRMFFFYNDEFEDIQNEAQEEIRMRAQEISQGIAQLELPSKIESKDHYRTLYDSAYSLKLPYDEDNANEIIELVEDYGKIDRYLEDLEELRKNYQITCSNCKGNGGFTCKTCSGGGRVTCSSCNGRGKKLVTWYSEGNWGDTSYSSYECTSCNGSGKRSCPSCNNGKDDCGYCDGGYIYIYEDERNE